MALSRGSADGCRPVAFSAGATDEVSHSMGQQRVQLGMNVVATALPADDESSTQPEDVVLYFGIIDILQVTLPAAAPAAHAHVRGSAYGQGPHCKLTGRLAVGVQSKAQMSGGLLPPLVRTFAQLEWERLGYMC